MTLLMWMLGASSATATPAEEVAPVLLEIKDSPNIYVFGLTCTDLTIRGQDEPGVRVLGTLNPELEVRHYPDKSKMILTVEPKDTKKVSLAWVTAKVKRNGRMVITRHPGEVPPESCGSLVVEVPTELSLFVTGQRVQLDGKLDQLRLTGSDLKVTSRAQASNLKFLALGELDVEFELAPEVAQITSYDGAVTVSGGSPQRLDIKAMGGRVTLEMEEAHAVRVSSTQGDIVFGGALLPQSHLQLDSHKGDIDLRIPAESNAALSMTAPPGQISSVIPGVTVPSAPEGNTPVRKLELQLGQGGAVVDASTFRGRVTLTER